MLNPTLSKADTDYEQILEKLADQYVENTCDVHAPGSEFFPPGLKKKRWKDEFKESVHINELGEHLKDAVSLLFDEGKQYLDDREYGIIQNELILAKKAFLELSLGDEMPKILYPRLGFSSQGVRAIDSIARKLYITNEYSKAISLNVLLTILNEREPIYWYNLGICFQENGNYEKAILAYACCHQLDPKNVGAYLFSTECYLKLNNTEDAKLELAGAEQLIIGLPIQDPWDKLVSGMKIALGI